MVAIRSAIGAGVVGNRAIIDGNARGKEDEINSTKVTRGGHPVVDAPRGGFSCFSIRVVQHEIMANQEAIRRGVVPEVKITSKDDGQTARNQRH